MHEVYERHKVQEADFHAQGLQRLEGADVVVI